MNLESIAAACGGAKREGKGWRCLCPNHNDRSPSLSINQSPAGKLLVRCFSGCPGIDVLRAINRLTGGAYHRPISSGPEQPESTQEAQNTQWAVSLWQSARKLHAGDLAARYLMNRGLDLSEENFPDSLKFHPACKISDVSGVAHLPALLARFDDAAGNLSTVHRIYLQEPGCKADIDRPKRIYSPPAKGGAIRLYPATERIGIAEGIETAIACFVATGIPTWSVYSSGMMPHVVLPVEVKEVIIFGDNDRAGQRAADRAATRLVEQGFKVKIIFPPSLGEDWLDVWCKGRNSNVK